MMRIKRKIKDKFGKMIEGFDIGVTESIGRFSEITLDDGTILKTKMDVLQAVRIDDKWDNEGNPLYVIKAQNIVTVVKSPEELKSPRKSKEEIQ